MCWVLYIAADHPLPLIPWQPEAPAFNVTPLREVDEAVRARFAAGNVAYLGSHTGCGCGFDPGQANPAHPDEARDNATSLAALRAYVEARAEASAARRVELYTCWDGDEGMEPHHRLEITADALHLAMEWFPERSHVTVRAPAP